MTWIHDLLARTSALFHHHADERDLDEELRFHLEMEANSHLGTGTTPEEARRRAMRDFGGVERFKEEVRDERGTRPLDDLVQDVRFAWRALMRRPALTVVAALTLALGIGATTTLFGVVKSALLAPLPWFHPASLVELWSSWKGYEQTWISYDEWEGYRADVKAFADVALFTDGAAMFSDGDGEPERIRMGEVSENTFRVLGVAPLLGRGFTLDEDRPKGPQVVVLGYGMWQRRFGGNPSVIGRVILVGGKATTVVGVMPAGFRLPLDFGAAGATRAWFPLATDAPSEGGTPGPAFNPNGGNHGFYGVARLRPGATAEKASAQMAALIARVKKDGSFIPPPQFRPYAVAMEQQVTGRVRPVLLIVFAAVGIVLLIACVNVAGLLLVRGEQRRREIAVRIAMGVGMSRLIRLLLAESAVLAGIGGLLGIAFAAFGVWLVRHTAPAALARVAETHLDFGVLSFAVITACAAAVLSGLLPAAQAARVAPAVALHDGGRSATAGAGRLRWRQLLVATEIALAVVLVTSAGVMIRSVRALLAIDSGFRAEGVLTMRLSMPSVWYPDSVRVVAFWDELQRRVSAIPSVDAVGAARLLPLASEMGDWGLQVEGYTPLTGEYSAGDWQVVTPGYFEAMKLHLRAGRAFDARDGMNAPLAMVINQRFAEKYFAGRDPIGGRVTIGGSEEGLVYTVVGVAEDVHHNGLAADVRPQFYAPAAQFARAPGKTSRTMTLVVHSTRTPSAIVAQVRGVVHGLDARLPISEVRPMSDVVDASIAEPRFAMWLLSLFGVLALALSAIGIFGIVSQVIAARSHEFGIRAALGAHPLALLLLSLRAGVVQTAAGLIVGGIAALALSRGMTAMLHGVAPVDFQTFVGVVVVTAAVAIVASVWPARRAALTNPATILRES